MPPRGLATTAERLAKQICVQPRSSAVNTALPAFAAERRRTAIDRYLLPAGAQQQIPLHAAAVVDRRDRRTDARQFHRPCSA